MFDNLIKTNKAPAGKSVQKGAFFTQIIDDNLLSILRHFVKYVVHGNVSNITITQ